MPEPRRAVPQLRRGSVVWLDFDPTQGREQSGHRPALVIASDGYLVTATTIAVVLPVTTTDRGWPNHVLLRGDQIALDRPSFAMTEQPRTIDRRRITSMAGFVDMPTLNEIDIWLRDFLDL